MTKTKEQRAQECVHFLGLARCGNRQHLQGAVVGRCALYCGYENCPDFTPKNDKDDNQTDNARGV